MYISNNKPWGFRVERVKSKKKNIRKFNIITRIYNKINTTIRPILKCTNTKSEAAQKQELVDKNRLLQQQCADKDKFISQLQSIRNENEMQLTVLKEQIKNNTRL